MILAINNPIAFTSDNRKQKQKEAEKKVVTGGGAVAATASVARVKATKSGMDMFASTGKISRGMNTVTGTARAVGNVAKQSKGLWAKVCENAKWAKNAILNWGKSVQQSKFLKPLIKNPAFKCFAGFLGYGFGVITLISGLSDITKVASDAVEKLDK